MKFDNFKNLLNLRQINKWNQQPNWLYACLSSQQVVSVGVKTTIKMMIVAALVIVTMEFVVEKDGDMVTPTNTIMDMVTTTDIWAEVDQEADKATDQEADKAADQEAEVILVMVIEVIEYIAIWQHQLDLMLLKHQ